MRMALFFLVSLCAASIRNTGLYKDYLAKEVTSGSEFFDMNPHLGANVARAGERRL